MPTLVGRLFRFFLKLVLAVLGAIFALSLLAAALVVLALSLVKALLTGRKPAPAVVFSRFQRFSPGGVWPGAASRAPQGKGDVVDVEVREVPRTDQRLP